jgi:hypothetical protein
VIRLKISPLSNPEECYIDYELNVREVRLEERLVKEIRSAEWSDEKGTMYPRELERSLNTTGYLIYIS